MEFSSFTMDLVLQVFEALLFTSFSHCRARCHAKTPCKYIDKVCGLQEYLNAHKSGRSSRKTATTYALLHRSQDDPLIHDENAPDRVLQPISGPSSSAQLPDSTALKIRHRGDLETDFGYSADIRENEGEAAEYGVFFDDSKYDYMQHLRELGGGNGSGAADVAWLEAPNQKQKGKGKEKQTLEDALREVNLDEKASDFDDTRSLGGFSAVQSVTSSRFGSRMRTYQDQQDIPDAIAGFQPAMDPRLREVLEALDDEAYVEDDDDIFGELTGRGAEEVDDDEFERTRFGDEDDEGWESDRTEKPAREYSTTEAWIPAPTAETLSDAQQITVDGLPDPAAAPPATTEGHDGDWLASFTKTKNIEGKQPGILDAIAQSPSSREVLQGAPGVAESSIISSSTTNPFGRKKKRKGARTSTTNFSMTSSALARTEPLTTLDARFDRLEAEYMNDDFDDDMILEEDEDDNASVMTGITNKTGASRMSSMSKASMASRWSTTSGASQVPQLVPAQFDKVLDDFLGSPAAAKAKGRKMRKGGKGGVWAQGTGMDQLDEIRKGLGPARLRT